MLMYRPSESISLELGTGIVFQDGEGDQFFMDELYVGLRNKWLNVFNPCITVAWSFLNSRPILDLLIL